MSDALNLALTISFAEIGGGILRRVKDRIRGTGQAAQQVRRDFDDMERSLRKGIKTLAITGYVAKKLEPGVKAAADLQEQLLGARAELMGTTKDAAALGNQLKQIQSTAFNVQAFTPFNQAQIVELEKNLVKSGARIQAIVGKQGAAAAAAALATYENMDPTETGKALIGIGTPFKVKADNYMGLADDISRAASASTVGAQEIAESAKYAAGPMAALKRTPKEMLALVATMAQVGVTGTMAGTGIKNFFLQASKYKVFKQANGELKSTADIIDILHKKLDSKGSAEQQSILTKVFGQEGLPVAIALMQKGDGSFEDILDKMRQAAPLQDKLNEAMKGFNKQLTSLQGTSTSTISGLFQPALAPLTQLVAKSNELMANLGHASANSKGLNEAVSYGSMGIVGAGALLGGAMILKGGIAGAKVLKGLKGLGGMAGGVAVGKTLEAAAGVTPVFVVNMPGGLGGSMPGGFGGKGIPGDIAQKVRKLSNWDILKKANMGEIKALGPAAMLRSAGYVGLAGAGGYAIGSQIYDHGIAGTSLGDKIGSGIAHVLSLFGNEEAKAAIAANERAQQLNGTIKIQVDSKTGQASVTQMHMDRPGITLSADHGIPAGAW